MYCKNCGKQIDDKAVVCVHCGQITGNYYYPQQSANPAANKYNESYTPILGFIFSFIIGLVGLIISAVQYRRAKSVNGEAKYALAGIIVGSILVGLSILTTIVSIYEAMWAGTGWSIY